MADSFECPNCGKNYPRENRLVGKAVACECGRRFLVPPAESASPPSSSPPPLARPVANSTPAVATPMAGLKKPLQAARPAGPAAKPARWADPLPPNEPLPLTDADLIDDGPPSYPAAASVPPRAIPVGAPPAIDAGAPVGSPPARAAYAPPRIKTLNDINRHPHRDGAAGSKRWVIVLVVFLVLLLAGLSLLAVMLLKR